MAWPTEEPIATPLSRRPLARGRRRTARRFAEVWGENIRGSAGHLAEKTGTLAGSGSRRRSGRRSLVLLGSSHGGSRASLLGRGSRRLGGNSRTRGRGAATGGRSGARHFECVGCEVIGGMGFVWRCRKPSGHTSSGGKERCRRVVKMDF